MKNEDIPQETWNEMGDASREVTRPEMWSVPVAINCRGDGNQVLALIGSNIQEGCAGFGDTLPDALRDLASEIEKEVGYYHNHSVEVKGCNKTHWGIADCQECGLKAQYQANSIRIEL